MGDAVELSEIANAIELTEAETEALLNELMLLYEENDRGIRIVRVKDAFQMVTNSAYYEYLIRIAKQPKKRTLTDVLLETLSIIAYRQPVTKTEIDEIRGVSSEHAVSRLVEYGLVCPLGRKTDALGNPMLYGTTEDFLKSFGVTSITELPELSEDVLERFQGEEEVEVGV